MNLFRARLASQDESIKHGTSAQVETILCSNYQSEVLNKNESFTIPFDVRYSDQNHTYTCKTQRRTNVLQKYPVVLWPGSSLMFYNRDSRSTLLTEGCEGPNSTDEFCAGQTIHMDPNHTLKNLNKTF